MTNHDDGWDFDSVVTVLVSFLGGGIVPTITGTGASWDDTHFELHLTNIEE